MEEAPACEIARLPEDLLSASISRATPRDASRVAVVSSAFHTSADSDDVWASFLPHDLPTLADGELPPAPISKKELFLLLSAGPHLLSDRLMSMWLDRETGSKCYMLSARALYIAWGDTPQYWRWIPLTNSRFAEGAKLKSVCWLEIRGKINTKMLSPNSTYAAYMVFKLAEESYGLDHPLQEALVSLGGMESRRKVCVQSDNNEDGVQSDDNEDGVQSDDNEDGVQSDDNEDDGQSDDNEDGVQSDDNEDGVQSDDNEDGVQSDDNEDGVQSDDNEDGVQSDDNEDGVQSDDNEDGVQSDDNEDGVQSDDNEDVVQSDDNEDGVQSDENEDGVQSYDNEDDAQSDDNEDVHEENVIVPQRRADSWMELEMGEFFNEEGEDGEACISLTETIGGNWKRGLIVQGCLISYNLQHVDCAGALFHPVMRSALVAAQSTNGSLLKTTAEALGKWKDLLRNYTKSVDEDVCLDN
ncbi:hypothetical protein GUJ93_ZPchr0006g41000 [Zizania palustris]|uniref:F-box domain-containing protein n=1 Tax=Zizania palustris TaxID=103762 RepID=A0A8J5TDJ0_ZIZPA|nr:hypothetical protein GUJ93_ZPchr0006g41000 [Zizania palustris]